MKRYAAAVSAAAGCLVMFAGLVMLSPIAAIVILLGAVLLVLGLFVIEVPAT